MEGDAAPLRGVRVLDLSRYVVGAGATRRLVDLGAEVLKVESPGVGDRLRVLPPRLGDEGLWHLVDNAGKHSVEADLRDPDVVETVNRLVAAADVVVETGGRNAHAARGIDLEAAGRANPRLIVCSITAFGLDGAWADLKAHALNIDGLAGVHRTAPVSDHHLYFEELYYGGVGNAAASADAAMGVCAALASPTRGEQCTWLEVSCWDSAIYLNRLAASYDRWSERDLFDDHAEELHGARHAVYRASDGRLVYLATIERAHWERFCREVGRPDLLRDDEPPIDYGSADLVPVVADIIATRTAGEWQEAFVAWRLPGSMLLSPSEVLAGEHAISRQILGAGPRPAIGSPLRWGTERVRGRASDRPAPALGEQDLGAAVARWTEVESIS
jgi:crotonobetainyl-CoA:carnitine CoA-transferase CaiB-like acyl-CoA transferase